MISQAWPGGGSVFRAASLWAESVRGTPVRRAYSSLFFMQARRWGASQAGAVLLGSGARTKRDDRMDGDAVVIGRESPLGQDLALLFQRHTADMHADTPPESIHMLPRADLESPDIAFFVLREAGVPVGMGALKRISPDHAEIKSMHVLAEARGRGHSRRMLDALIAHARAEGMSRLSLETGVQPTFIAARGLYARAGFADCAAFGDYRPDPNSVFMTIDLSGSD